MDAHTLSARKWLDKRYRRKEDGSYFAHQPVDGLGTQRSEPNAMLRLARTYHLLTLFEGLQFDSFLDVGGGEGYVGALVGDLFGASVSSTDLSTEACRRARELFGTQSLAADATRLPFRDQSCDLVLCSEVIEHLSRPVWAISELARVARKYVVITTAESCPLGEWERALHLCLLDAEYAHAEQNWFTPQDFQVLLGRDLYACSQMRNLGGRVSNYFAQRNLTRDHAEKAIEFLTATQTLDLNHDGIMILWTRPEFRSPNRQAEPPPLSAHRHRQIFNRLLGGATQAPQASSAPSALDERLLDQLQCVVCGGELVAAENQISCLTCSAHYPVENGVPVMLTSGIPICPIDPVAGLAPGDAARADQVRALTAKLHGQRPLALKPWQRRLAQQLLRVLYFFCRPESIANKLQRVVRRLKRKEAALDFREIEQALSA